MPLAGPSGPWDVSLPPVFPPLRALALTLVVSHAFVASVPCAPAESRASEGHEVAAEAAAHGAHADHAHHDGGAHASHHAPTGSAPTASTTLKSPCPCGCEKSRSVAPTTARLGFAVLREAPALPIAPAARPGPVAEVLLPDAPVFRIEPVPV